MSESTSQPTIYCYCGCGLDTSPKANYRPGHDAKHVGAVARHLAEIADTNEWGGIADKALPTISLAAKAVMVAHNLQTRAAQQAERDAKKAQRERARAERLEAAQRKQTDRLAAKAVMVAHNLQTRAAQQAERDAKKAQRERARAERLEAAGIVETGEVKVGRWTYPTRTWDGGVIERNEKRDGSGAWIVIN